MFIRNFHFLEIFFPEKRNYCLFSDNPGSKVKRYFLGNDKCLRGELLTCCLSHNRLRIFVKKIWTLEVGAR